MKQNSIFSYVKRNNNNSEGMDGNEQCSSNVKEAPNPKWSQCNSIAKVRKWDDTYFRYRFFLPDDQILNVQQLHSKNARTAKSLNFLVLNICNNCLFVEVSYNEIFDFLLSSSFKKNVNEDSMTNVKVYQGFHDDKKVEECCSRF